MNTKLLASIAVFVLVTSVASISMTDSAFAAEDKKDKAMAKKDAMKDKAMAKKDAMKDKAMAKKDAMKDKAMAKKDAMKDKAMAKKDAMKDKAMAKKDAMKDKAMAKKDAMKDTTGQASGTAASEVTVDMAKGTANNQDCADQCFVQSTVTVAVGGKVTWKNVDTAAHTATASDRSFDTRLVTAGGSASNTFNTAGSYPYLCIVHPWMKGTVNVQ